MCPSPPLPDIRVYWADEEIFTTLEKIENGSPLPGNVIPLNPCQYHPSDLPAGIWYFISSGIQKEAGIGSWKTLGDACIIYEGLDVTGRRTSYKYYGDQDPNACQPDWVLQEYEITYKEMLGNKCPRDTGSLCRVFLSSAQGSSTDGQKILTGQQNLEGGESLATYLSEPLGEGIVRNGQGSGSRSHEYNRDDENTLVPVAGGLMNHPAENLPQFDGDFLELFDLDNPARSSSSSENSSCISMNSDDCFDSLELLRDLEPEVNSDEQQKSADCKFSILASVKPNEVVMHPGSAGFLANGNREHTPAQTLKIGDVPPGSSTEQNSQSGTAGRKVENDSGGSSSNPHYGDSSSGGHRATIVKRGASSKKTKILKSCLCSQMSIHLSLATGNMKVRLHSPAGNGITQGIDKSVDYAISLPICSQL